jgi:hypothetical protein
LSRIRYLLDENMPHGVRDQLLYHNPGMEVLCIGYDKEALIWGKTLEDKVNEWLEEPVNTHPTLMLLGEFGDGMNCSDRRKIIIFLSQ